MTTMSLLRLFAKRACLAVGLLAFSCLFSSCSTCANAVERLLSIPFNLLNYVLSSVLP